MAQKNYNYSTENKLLQHTKIILIAQKNDNNGTEKFLLWHKIMLMVQ